MAITLVATVGGTTSNSYITEAEADTILEENGRTDWAALDSEVKKAALIAATRSIEQYNFSGSATASTQALRWPREGMYTRDGYAIDNDEIPNDLKYATAELAYLFQSSNRFSETGTDGFNKIKVGSIELGIDSSTKAATVPSFVRDFISHYITYNPFNATTKRA